MKKDMAAKVGPLFLAAMLVFGSLTIAVERVDGRAIDTKTWKVWKTIKLGTYTSNDELRQALVVNGISMSEITDRYLQKLAVDGTTTQVDLVVVSVADLGFKHGATRQAIYNRAIDLGLQLAPQEVGPQLRLQYRNQPREEPLLIGMEPITDSYFGDQFVFYIAHLDYNLWIGAEFGNSDYFWGRDYRWVFARGH